MMVNMLVPATRWAASVAFLIGFLSPYAQEPAMRITMRDKFEKLHGERAHDDDTPF
jgi:hypothetical protein